MRSGNSNFALVPRAPSALEKAEPGTKTVLSGIVADTLALANKKQRSKRRIVILDDDSDILEFYKACISAWFEETTVLTFQDDADALRELTRSDPELLIMDMRRPTGNGEDVLALLVQRRVKYPVLVISGSMGGQEGVDVVCDYIRRGMNVDARMKPIEPENLRLMLCRLLKVDPEQTGSAAGSASGSRIGNDAK